MPNAPGLGHKFKTFHLGAFDQNQKEYVRILALNFATFDRQSPKKVRNEGTRFRGKFQ